LRLWIDECLTTTLVGQAQSKGYDATCVRDRGLLGVLDEVFLEHAIREGFVVVTNNHADFCELCASIELHAGLLILPQRRRIAQLPLLDKAIAYIEQQAARAGETPANWMVNRVVEMDETSETCVDVLLPS
jgi:Domain of unknown function (DUF5615)